MPTNAQKIMTTKAIMGIWNVNEEFAQSITDIIIVELNKPKEHLIKMKIKRESLGNIANLFDKES